MTDQFTDWVARQEPETTFDPYSCTACAGFQFLAWRGFPVDTCGVITWVDREGLPHLFPDAVSDAISWACDQVGIDQTRVTFGALSGFLASRLAASPTISGGGEND